MERYPENWKIVYDQYRKGQITGLEAINILKISNSTFYVKVKKYESENGIIRTVEEKTEAATRRRALKKSSSYPGKPGEWEEVYYKWKNGELRSKEAFEMLKISDTTFYTKVHQYEKEHGIEKKARLHPYPDRWREVYEKWREGEITSLAASKSLKINNTLFYKLADKYEIEEGIADRRSNKYKDLDRIKLFWRENAVKIREYNDYLERYILPRIDYGRLQESYGTNDCSYAKGILNRLYKAMRESYGEDMVVGRLKTDLQGVEGIFVPGVIAWTESKALALALLAVNMTNGKLEEVYALMDQGCCKVKGKLTYGYLYYEKDKAKRFVQESLPEKGKELLKTYHKYEIKLLLEN